ncbi:hypothetical protein F2Q69_00030740 [Brassica cretica]|uniref:Uncharacterized protein n=1 Tax=Brassica cretica TaxID=69181 RepID=A0A8S9RXW8_BRACR|nr:hypothetical protein F2Q69_00030740 [Brassica cretica]
MKTKSRYGDRKKSSRGRKKETKGIRRRNWRGRIENPRNTLHVSGGKTTREHESLDKHQGAPPYYFPSSGNLNLKKPRSSPIGTLSFAESKHQLRSTPAFPQSKGS